jgi:hypothetical protein
MERRKRTRELIELGGLVQKSGLAELMSDDRAALLGALLTLVESLDDDRGADLLLLWRRRGKRAFEIGAGPKATEAP